MWSHSDAGDAEADNHKKASQLVLVDWVQVTGVASYFIACTCCIAGKLIQELDPQK